MNEPDKPDNNERSIFSSKFDEKPNPSLDRYRNAPPVPKVKKTRTQAILTAAPVLMLLAGFGYYWYGERQQRQGVPIVSEQQEYVGAYDRLTPRGDKSGGSDQLRTKNGAA